MIFVATLSKSVYADTLGAWVLVRGERTEYDEWNPVAQNDATGAVVQRHLWGTDLSGTPQGAGGVGGLLGTWDNGGTTRDGTKPGDSVARIWVCAYDGNGNVSAAIAATMSGGSGGGGSGSGGPGTVRVARYDYDAFGKTLATWGDGAVAEANRYRFSTKPEDWTGLLYYGYRYLDTRTGRWVSRDPIGERGGRNMFALVRNRPVSDWDPLGLEPFHRARNALRRVTSTVVSIPTGDAFVDDFPEPPYEDDQCRFLITVTGINMTDAAQAQFAEQAKRSFLGIPNVTVSKNYSAFRVKISDPDNEVGVGDLGQILLNETIAMADKPARFLPRKIRSAAEKAKENGCSCWCINVLAHSQGTMVFELALKFFRGETDLLKHIRFEGMGGQTTIGVEKHGVGSARNLAHYQDPVPRMGQFIPFDNGFGPPEETCGDPNEYEKPIEAHLWIHYLKYLSKNPSTQSCISQ